MSTNERRSWPTKEHDTDESESTDSTRYYLANSCVTVERGPAGSIVRIEKFGDEYKREYGGPVAYDTLRALSEVSWHAE